MKSLVGSEASQKTCHIVNGIAPAANGRVFSVVKQWCGDIFKAHHQAQAHKSTNKQPPARAKTASGSTCFMFN